VPGRRADPAHRPGPPRWDRLLIRRGLAALERAEQLGLAPGLYAVQADIAACHARAVSVKDTDWERIAALYVVLAHLTPSPVVELNRAVAVGMAYGPARGLEIADKLTDQPALAGYVQLPAVRGDLLAKLGRLDEARQEFTRAAALTATNVNAPCSAPVRPIASGPLFQRRDHDPGRCLESKAIARRSSS